MSMHMSVAPLRALDRIGCSLLGQRDCTRSKRHCLQRASLGVTEETIEDDQCSRRSRSISAQWTSREPDACKASRLADLSSRVWGRSELERWAVGSTMPTRRTR